MQLSALLEGKKVDIKDARKGENYLCPECGSTVRPRKGVYRIAHFFHLEKASCSLREKSAEHIQTQLYIKKAIEDVFLEKPFPSIGRIADAAWEKEKIIFEVQCSAISLKEMWQRCEDYGSIGYTTVWILHDARFNKKTLCQAEYFIKSSKTAYFTDIDKEGRGVIYDQFERLSCQKKRLFKGEKRAVDIRFAKRIPPQQDIPEEWAARSAFGLYFPGDLYSYYLQNKEFLNKNSIDNESKNRKKAREYYKDLLVWIAFKLAK